MAGFAGQRSIFGEASAASLEVYLNLTPLMDVMSNILFFLLAAFGASAVAIYPVTVPVDAAPSSAPADPRPEDRVTVHLRADRDGFTLTCQNPSKLPDELKVCRQKVPKRNGQPDLTGLTQALKVIKQAFPGANALVVVPEPHSRYQAVVRIVDAARTLRAADGTALPLFPEVIMGKAAD